MVADETCALRGPGEKREPSQRVGHPGARRWALAVITAGWVGLIVAGAESWSWGADAEPVAAVEDFVSHARNELYRDDATMATRTSWAVALLLAGTPASREVVIESLRPGVPTAVRAAVCGAMASEQLVRPPGGEFDMLVWRCLLESNEELADRAAAATGRLARRVNSCLEARLRLLLADGDPVRVPPPLRRDLARAVGHLSGRSAYFLLLGQLPKYDRWRERSAPAGGSVSDETAMTAVVVQGLQRLSGRLDWNEPWVFGEAGRVFAELSDADFDDHVRRVRVRRLELYGQSHQALEEDLVRTEAALLETRPVDQHGAVLADKLAHRQSCVRVWAAQQVLSLPDRALDARMLPVLIEGVGQPGQPDVRATFATALAYVELRLRSLANGGGTPNGVVGPARLRSQLARETNPEVCAALLTALATYRQQADIAVVGRWLTDPRDVVAEAAVGAFGELARMGTKGSGGTPSEVADRQARRRAAEPFVTALLELIGPYEGMPAVASRGESVRITALRSAHQVLGSQAMLAERAGQLMGDPSAAVREAAVAVFEGFPGQPEVLARLGPMLGDANRRVRSAAIQAVATVAQGPLLSDGLARLESRLPDETDPEVLYRLITVVAGLVERLPQRDCIIWAQRQEHIEMTAGRELTGSARLRAALLVRCRLLDGDQTALEATQRGDHLRAAAELAERVGDLAEATSRHRQRARLARGSPNDAAAAAVAAFRCAVVNKRPAEGWEVISETHTALASVGATAADRLAQMVWQELGRLIDSGADEAVGEALAGVPMSAAWSRSESFVTNLAVTRSAAAAARQKRLARLSAQSVQSYLSGDEAARAAAVTSLNFAGVLGVEAVVSRLAGELIAPRPNAVWETALLGLLRKLMAKQPPPAMGSLDLDAYNPRADLTTRLAVVKGWQQTLAAVSGATTPAAPPKSSP